MSSTDTGHSSGKSQKKISSQRPKKDTSQRKLLMKKIIDKKLQKLTRRKRKCHRNLSHQDIALLAASARKSKTKVSKKLKSRESVVYSTNTLSA